MYLHGGLDLHGDNVYLGLMDTSFNRVFERRLPNDLAAILAALEPYRKRVVCLVVESTYNWYWLVDGLQDKGYVVKLANPARMQENIGLKHADDRSDAFFLAKQSAMGVLPEGYIYPREERGVRDLLRRRTRLVRDRTAEWLSIEGLIARHSGQSVGIRQLNGLEAGELRELLGNDPMVLAAVQMSFRHVEFLNKEIKKIEAAVEGRVELRDGYDRLMNVPGIGRTLTMTIMLETGPIGRFAGPGNYASYCRAVESSHDSNDKKKGEGNRKNGNKYLAWAYVEAACFSIRHCPELRAWYQRKASKTKRVIALKALANKLSKACFFILRDGVQFDVTKLVG